jgi:creatinine amidohydrolase
VTISLADLAWPDAARHAEVSLLAVPIGATEQHGPHLPLSTDTNISVSLAERLSARRPYILVAPPVAYGSSGEHAGFAGTLSIGQVALELLLVELGRSAAVSFARTLFICAHGGNAEPLRRAEQRLVRDGHDVRAFFPTWSGDAHAGWSETSVMLAVAPEQVRCDRAETGVTTPVSELLPMLKKHGLREVTPNGVLGDPAGASAAAGSQLLEAAIDQLIAMVDAWP